MKINFSASKELSKGFMPVELDFEEFYNITKSNVNYSPNQFKDNYRNNKNYTEGKTDLIILDYDSNIDIRTAGKMFSNYNFLIATTKSHQKVKNNKICDRFRLILPTHKITLDAKEYTFLMKYFAKRFHSDQKATDAARFFYGYKNAYYWYNKGKPFNWESYYIPAKEIQIMDSFNIPENDGGMFAGVNIKNSLDDEEQMKKIFKPHLICSGERNDTLARYALWLRDEGLNSSDAIKTINWINDQMPKPLSSSEVESILRNKF